jgi:hypothetical protein
VCKKKLEVRGNEEEEEARARHQASKQHRQAAWDQRVANNANNAAADRAQASNVSSSDSDSGTSKMQGWLSELVCTRE